MKEGRDAAPPVDAEMSHRLAQLEKQVAELSEAVAARDTFLAVAAHELRNPMTPILAHVQRLRRFSIMNENAEAARGLHRLEKLVEHYIRRATALLDVSRMTTGKLSLHPERVDLAEMLRDAVDATLPAARYAGSTLHLEVPEHLFMSVDRLAIEQIIDNLLSNAVKYGQGRPISVTLHATGREAIVRVRDCGGGISPDDRARIFERFERAVAQGSAIGGFGVGLWVVGQLVEAMGADIGVDSQVGQGTTFTLRFPIQDKGTEMTQSADMRP